MRTFWQWLFWGSGGKEGLGHLFDRWLIFHLLVSLYLLFKVEKDLEIISTSILLPVASVIIALSFAWASSFHAIIQTKELDQISLNHSGGIQDYIFLNQLAFLVLLVTFLSWGIAGLGVFAGHGDVSKKMLKFGIFFLTSLSIRECWGVVLQANMMIIGKKVMEKANEKQ